jgi:hypothetical protein
MECETEIWDELTQAGNCGLEGWVVLKEKRNLALS